jgi:hypothetical protein
MKVREDLGNDAVARACSEIYQLGTSPQNGRMQRTARSDLSPAAAEQREENETCIQHSGEQDAPLQIVEIQDQTYGLSLGWKISQTSFAVVSWMLGKPSTCFVDPRSTSAADSSSNGQAGQRTDNKQLTWQIVNRNSCVENSIQHLVEDAPSTAKSAAQPHPVDPDSRRQ